MTGQRAGRPTGDVLDTIDRSNTNPVCEHCGYRTVALDRCRSGCTRCGVIVHVESRIIRLLLLVFGGRVVVAVNGGDHAGRQQS